MKDESTGSTMGFGTYLANGFRMLTFNAPAVTAVRDDPESKSHSMWLTLILAVCCGLAIGLILAMVPLLVESEPDQVALFNPQFGFGVGFLIGAIGLILMLLVSAGVLHALARVFGGTATIMQFYAVMVAIDFGVILLNIPMTILGLIPILGVLISLVFFVYTVALTVFIVRQTYGLTTGRAIAVSVIPMVLLLVVLFVVIGAFAYFGALSPAAMP